MGKLRYYSFYFEAKSSKQQLETLLLAGIDDTDKMLWPDGYNYSFLEQPRVLNHLKNVDPALAAEKGAKERGRFLLELQNNYGFTLGFQDRGRDGREGNENNTDPQSGNHGITRAIAGATQSLEKVLLYLQTNDIEGLFRHNPMIVWISEFFPAPQVDLGGIKTLFTPLIIQV